MRSFLTALGLVLATSCGSEKDVGAPHNTADAALDTAPSDSARAEEVREPSLFNVHVSYDYKGSQMGKFGVGAFLHNPPDGAPLAFVRLGNVKFPGKVDLRGLEPGSFYVSAVLDVPPDDPTIPGPEDLVATSPLLTLDNHDLDVELTLTDKGDGGAP
ncbi:MAG: hypothetical protein NVSMB1_24640 [Polyangiales bacterium]